MPYYVQFYVKVIVFLLVELAKSEAEEISFIYNQPLWLVNLWMNEMGRIRL